MFVLDAELNYSPQILNTILGQDGLVFGILLKKKTWKPNLIIVYSYKGLKSCAKDVAVISDMCLMTGQNRQVKGFASILQLCILKRKRIQNPSFSLVRIIVILPGMISLFIISNLLTALPGTP